MRVGHHRRLLFAIAGALLFTTAVAFASVASSAGADVVGRTTAALAQPLSAPGGPWALKFSDDFTGSSLNLAKWTPNWLGANDTSITPPINSAELDCYSPKQVSTGGGGLTLRAVNSTCRVGGRSYAYTSGLIETAGKFEFTYGYAQARIWTPSGTGLWPAFWLDGQSWPKDGEIDVLEAYGNNVSTYHFHYAGCGSSCGPGGGIVVPNASAGWHTYAVNWERHSITWYYDGHQVWQFTGAVVTTQPMYLIMNLATDASAAALPASIRVASVEVWQHA